MKRLFVVLAVMAFAVVSLSFSAANAASGVNAKRCGVSDRSDVTVNKNTGLAHLPGPTRGQLLLLHQHPGLNR